MKYVSLILFGLMMSIYIPLSAQTEIQENGEDLVGTPANLLTKFSHDYPQTIDTKWIFVDDAYVVEYTTAEKGSHKVWYDKSGEKLKEQHDLNPKADLPKPVKEALRNRFGSYQIKNISQESARGVTSYRINLNENGMQKEVVVNGDGTFKETEFK